MQFAPVKQAWDPKHPWKDAVGEIPFLGHKNGFSGIIVPLLSPLRRHL